MVELAEKINSIPAATNETLPDENSNPNVDNPFSGQDRL